jgi:hypothetical protein
MAAGLSNPGSFLGRTGASDTSSTSLATPVLEPFSLHAKTCLGVSDIGMQALISGRHGSWVV